MKKFLAVFFCLLSSEAFGQAAVTQYGAITPFNLPRWSKDHVVEDAGGIQGKNGRGVNPFSILDNKSIGLCSYTDLTSKPYSSICLGHDSSGNALIVVDSAGGAPNGDLSFVINDSKYPFPGTGNGNISGPTPTLSGNVATWNSTTGTLLQDSRVTLRADALATDFGQLYQAFLMNGSYTGTGPGPYAEDVGV